MGLLQSLVLPHLMRRRSSQTFRDRGPSPQDAVPGFLPPPRQHERVNLKRLGHGPHLDAFQLAESYRLELELQTVSPDFRGASSGHRTPPLGGSVYFIEGGSAVGSQARVGAAL